MVTVYSFPAGFGLPSLSPFCTKVLVHLTLAGIAYEVKAGNPRIAPRGKLPCIRDEDGQILGDSGLVLAYLTEKTGCDLDRGLGPEERALGHVVRRMLEEHFYWSLVYSRWIDEAGWVHQKEVIAPLLPPMLRPILLPVLRSSVRKALHAHGLGRHDRATVYALGVEDLRALDALVRGDPYFFGSEPTGLDAILYAFAGAPLRSLHDNPLTDAVRSLPRLRALVEAVERRYRERGGVDAPRKAA